MLQNTTSSQNSIVFQEDENTSSLSLISSFELSGSVLTDNERGMSLYMLPFTVTPDLMYCNSTSILPFTSNNPL